MQDKRKKDKKDKLQDMPLNAPQATTAERELRLTDLHSTPQQKPFYPPHNPQNVR